MRSQYLLIVIISLMIPCFCKGQESNIKKDLSDENAEAGVMTTGGREGSYKTTTLLISDFGIQADSRMDATPAVKKAIQHAATLSGDVVIEFPKGRYDFYKEQSSHIHLPVTGIHEQYDFHTPFLLNGLKNLTIEGNGSFFWYHGRQTYFFMTECENITFRNTSLDIVNPLVHELTVINVDDNTLDVKVHPDSHYEFDESNRMTWLDGDGKGEYPDLVQQYDPITESTWRTSGVIDPCNGVKEMGPGVLRLVYKPVAGKTKVGDVFQIRWTIRNQQGIVIESSKNIQFVKLNIHAWNGFGFIAQMSENLYFRNLRMEPRPESQRTNAGFADAFHICSVKGDVIVENSRINGLHDDHFISYGNYMTVGKIENPRELVLNFPDPYLCGGFNMFFPGHKIGFKDSATVMPVSENEIVLSERINRSQLRIVLKEELSDLVKHGFLVENRTMIPDKLVIRNNYLGRVPSRSLLIFLCREALIENNTFIRTQMPAILIQTPEPPYNIQGMADNVTIRNNTFYECKQAGVLIYLQASKYEEGKYGYSNVRILDNYFINRTRPAFSLWAKGVTGLEFRGNRIESTGESPTALYLSHCADVTIIGNLLLNPSGTASYSVNDMDLKEVKFIPEEQWFVNVPE